MLCNLPARKMRGIPSAGMLLCASNADHSVVEPLLPPEEAQPGDRVFFGEEISSQTEPATPNQVCVCQAATVFLLSLLMDSVGKVLQLSNGCLSIFYYASGHPHSQKCTARTNKSNLRGVRL